tara:strand:- start:254 stop:733 length:480 start_codon:yes stop_codon:yes gene_type:complete
MNFFIRSRKEAERYQTDLSGRAENLLDDYLGASPDYEDITSVDGLLQELSSFPAIVGPLSSSESEMLLQTIENVRDIESLGGGTWRIRSEKGLTLLSVHVDPTSSVNADLDAILKTSEEESFPLCVEYGGESAKIVSAASWEAKSIDCLQAIGCGGFIN